MEPEKQDVAVKPPETPRGSDEPGTNPHLWTPWKRWSIITVVSYVECLTHLTSLMYAPGLAEVQREFDGSGPLTSFSMTIYVLGFAVGPLLLAPLSEVWGRAIIYRICILLFLVFTIACALSTSLDMLIAFRFFAGCFGAAPVAIGGAIVADLFPVQRRGKAMGLYQMGPLAGPLLGPVIGGFVIQQKGWRWVFWVVSILAGFAVICVFIVVKETHRATLLHRERGTQKFSLRRTVHSNSNGEANSTITTVVLRALSRPLVLLFRSPVVVLCCLIVFALFGTMNIIFSTLGIIYQTEYLFSAGLAGLVYLSMALGSVSSALCFGFLSDRVRRRLSARNDGLIIPELRLALALVGTPLGVAGLFWYGWAAQAHTYFLVPLLGLFVVGFGLTTMQLSTSLYLVDTFTVYAASALAAFTVARSTGGALIPLGGQSLYSELGFGWGNSILAFVNLIMWVICGGLYLYGSRLRAASFDFGQQSEEN